MAGENLKTFTTDEWQQAVIDSEKPVLVDFWAAWCGPCRMVGPIVEEIAEEYVGKMVVGKLNVDENNAIAAQYEVMTIPTLAVFKEGKIVDKVIGFRPKEELEKLLSAYC
ncbi:MAG: thioredoxin [Peptococcaceae bacterium]|jgi:thioredoxin 1|nr:thioredoxin [Peptococcaceae bacterium]